jgi:uncharacterized protein YoxC
MSFDSLTISAIIIAVAIVFLIGGLMLKENFCCKK